MPTGFMTGLDVLASRERRRLARCRVGLLTHPAAVTVGGVHAAQALRDAGIHLVALFGPEHGYSGAGGAGDHVSDAKHPAWKLPIFSLYGQARRPTGAMLRGIDVLVFDLQDLAVRCYTFASTLRYVMEACAQHGKALVVCDRPVPFPNTVDGPLLDPRFESFVACIDAPLVYGMTPGETALWLKATLKLDLDLHVVPMRGWHREAQRPAIPWIPPSPGIRSWETAWSYPATVWAEALTAIDIGRGGTTPFQVVTAPWLDAQKLARSLKFEGAMAQPFWGNHPGVRLVVTDPARFKPVAAGLQIIQALGPKAWSGARLEWLDKLMGTDSVRHALKRGDSWKKIAASWQSACRVFSAQRAPHLLYGNVKRSTRNFKRLTLGV